MGQWKEFKEGLDFPVFDKETEKSFVLDYNQRSLFFLRIALVLILVVTTIPFGILDNYMLPINKKTAWAIRLFVQTPPLLLAIFISYRSIGVRYFQWLAFIPNFILSLSIIFFIYISEPEELAYTEYYSGVLLVMMTMVGLRMRVRWTLVNLFLTSGIYIFVIIFFKRMLTTEVNPNHPSLFVNSMMFLATTILVVALVNYLLENFSRRNYESSILLRAEKKLVEESLEEINTQHERIEEINTTLQYQNEKIQTSHKRITDSISYAKRIQEQLLPKKNKIDEQIIENFILYQPKDIVSGDFYWFVHLDGVSYLAIADCTGHGVPGAFLSFIGHSTLNKAMFEKGMTEPYLLLNYLSIEVNRALQSEGGVFGMKNGMDLTLCAFDLEKKTVRFSGARNPLIHIREGNIERYKTNPQSIGESFDEQFTSFSQQEIELKKGDCIYLYSDGFADQFGGKEGKKYMSKYFREKLLQIYLLPMKEQKQVLKKELSDWKGGNVQTDDVLVFGMKV